VKRVCIEAYAHQDLPFEKLVQALQPARRLDHSPLFQTMFVLQTVPMPSMTLRDLTASFVEVTRNISLFDLTLELEETPQGVKGFFEYNTDLFDADRIDRMAGHWQTLIEGLVKDSSCRIDSVPLMREEEQRSVSELCHAFEAGEQPQLCLHDLVETRAQRTPDTSAVVWNDESLSYRMLANRANRLAHYLRTLGVGPEVRVGLYGERSSEMVVGILGILKAGGVCVPLDPSHPLDRLNDMIDDVRPAVVVTVSDLASRLTTATRHIVCLDADRAAIAAQPDMAPASGVCPDHPAYVLYTSGSTGRPKGVVLSHRSLVSYIIGAVRQCEITSSDRVLQFASFGFDVALEEVFMAFYAGATLVLRPSDLGTMESFMDVLDRERITVADLPTAFWHAWVQSDAFNRGLSDNLRLVMIGGEAALTAVYDKWARNHGDITLMNLYGPAETTISASFFHCQSGSVSNGPAIPIGRPFPGVHTYVLDRHLAPVPIGLPGELYIGGHGVARGYWNQPALTADRFVPDPFGGEGGARLYRTGDLCRYRTDGVIEFLGRIDRQVKVRGHRIEPSEIETALRQHEAVAEAVLLVRDDPSGDKRLIAYVQQRLENQTDSESLRRYLMHKLPNYMVPAQIVLIERWPLSPNGKIDRRALPLPEVCHGARPATNLMPRTLTEELLASIWAEILGIESVRRDDDFFALGGHSLLATQLMSRVLYIFQVELPVRALFECPTLTELANRIEGAQEQHGGPPSRKNDSGSWTNLNRAIPSIT
jgi:amino acid adenylation domain-containing protein